MKKIGADMLTIQEKLRMLCAADRWRTYDCDGKLPSLFVSDGPVGLRTECVDGNGKTIEMPSVAYPAIQTLANTWNKELARKIGECLADDAIERNADVLLAPGVNIKRHPLNGRNFEYFSEDPYLAGVLAREYIFGLQDKGVGACLKHFCCNNIEFNRRQLSSEVDERTLREIYLKPFEIACEAKPVCVMSSYNRINGEFASEFSRGFEILRNEFGFDGIILSDWHSVKNRAKSAKAGLDIEFPFYDVTYNGLLDDHKAGKITEADINKCVDSIIDILFRIQDMKKSRKITRASNERKLIAAEVVREGAVLLKNDGILPIKKGTSVCVNGSYGRPSASYASGGGSSCVKCEYENFDLASLLGERLGESIPFSKAFDKTHIDGAGDGGSIPEIGLKNALLSDVNIVCVGTGADIEKEGEDRRDMRLPDVQERFILHASELNRNTVVVMFAGAPIDMSAWIDKVKAVLYVGLCGPNGADAIADILCGISNPSGKLSETFPVNIEAVPAVNTYRDMNVICYSEGLNVGYRYFDRCPQNTLFPFGFGLSYSRFEYSDLVLSADPDGVRVRFRVENTSDVDGKETAQLYIRECMPKVYRPIKELKCFDKKFISAGNAEWFDMTIGSDALKYFSAAKNKWIADDGVYEIIIGSSSQDIRLRARISLDNGELHIL